MAIYRNILIVLWSLLGLISLYLTAYFISRGGPASVNSDIVYFFAIVALNIVALLPSKYQLFCVFIMGFDTITLTSSIFVTGSLKSGIYTNICLLLTIVFLYHQHFSKKA